MDRINLALLPDYRPPPSTESFNSWFIDFLALMTYPDSSSGHWVIGSLERRRSSNYYFMVCFLELESLLTDLFSLDELIRICF